MKVSQVATALQISPPSVRNWAREFRDHLGPATNPGKDATRFFDQSDLQVLALVKSLRDSGLGYDQIRQELTDKLASGEVPDLPMPLAVAQPLDEPRSLAVSMMGQFERLLEALRDENQDLRERNTDLERRLAKAMSQLEYHQKSVWQRIRGE